MGRSHRGVPAGSSGHDFAIPEHASRSMDANRDRQRQPFHGQSHGVHHRRTPGPPSRGTQGAVFEVVEAKSTVIVLFFPSTAIRAILLSFSLRHTRRRSMGTASTTKARSFGENIESDLASRFLRVVEIAAIASAGPWVRAHVSCPTRWPPKPCGEPWTTFPCAAPCHW